MWETKDVLLILAALGAAVTTIAVVRTQVTALATKVGALEEGARRQGERIGSVEMRLIVNAAVSKALGTPAFGLRIPSTLLKRPSDDGGTDGGT